MTDSLLHHISFGVTDLGNMAAFYDAVLAPLGQVRVWDGPQSVGYGHPGQDDKLLLNLRDAGAHPPGAGFHIAFSASSRKAVDQFHAAALAHGGKDNGPPGLREHYGPNYYAAFVVDPEGHRIEAVINRACD
ncbi:VOC family protein [Pelomonas aquatica]|uniref:VOC family protein n=1 Tax=Pelomonas aquatica TaxID=431058 RepID=UPI00286CDACD|nr:VOC family protein [Pelomonas aquatica]